MNETERIIKAFKLLDLGAKLHACDNCHGHPCRVKGNRGRREICFIADARADFRAAMGTIKAVQP